MTWNHLAAHNVLTTTRAVRKRLDFDKPLDRETVLECVAVAQQAPAGSNNPSSSFVIVDDKEKKAAIGEVYRDCFAKYKSMDGVYIGTIKKGDPDLDASQQRSASSADYLADRMADAPYLVIACGAGRVENMRPNGSISMLGHVSPAMWSFMLAARDRGLGTCWTTVHLMREKDVADIVGIPYDEVQQVCLSPVAYTTGVEFKPAPRPEPSSIVHWNTWGAS